MAAPLRHALRLLAWAAVALIYLPLLPAAALMALPALRRARWLSLFADPQFSQALAATLVSTLLSVGGALIITLTVVAALWPSGGWRLAAAGRKAPSAAGGTSRGLRHRSPAALRRWRLAPAPVALFYPAG